MKRLHKILAGAAGAVTLLASAAVLASPHGMGCGGEGHGKGMMGGGHMGGQQMRGEHMGGQAGAMSAQRLERLKTRLQITPAQDAVWTAFASKAKEQSAQMQSMMAAPANKDMAKAQPAPERMARHTEMMSQRLAGMQSVNAAFKDLYAQLTPEQQALADKGLGMMQRGKSGDGQQRHEGRRDHKHS